MQHLEHRLESQYSTWLDSLGVLHCASIGGVNLGRMPAIRMKRKGYKRGFPDHMILEPRGDWHGMFVELKVGVTKKNPDQDRWLDELRRRGYYTYKVPNGLDFWGAWECLEVVTKTYLGIK